MGSMRVARRAGIQQATAAVVATTAAAPMAIDSVAMRVTAVVRPTSGMRGGSESIDTNAHTNSNLMPPIRDAAAYATVDEASCRHP